MTLPGASGKGARAARVLLGVGLLAGMTLTGCSWFDEEGPPLPGERVSVMQLDRALKVDPDLADVKVRLPKPAANADWPQPGGNQMHAMYHVALGSKVLSKMWTVDAGAGASGDNRLLAEPVVADGVVYVMDADSIVSALDAKSGQHLWRVDLTPKEEDDDLFGGGLAVAEGKVFVTTPYARVFALDAKSGKTLWESPAPAPMRAAPAVSDGRVFAVTIDNQLEVYATDDGRKLWSNAGVEEAAGFLGGATPAVLGATVVAAYTSGELLAFDVVNGRSLWSDNLAGKARGDAIATLTDIRGRPAIDRDEVIAIGNGGVIAAINLKQGGRVWDASIGGTQSPWVAGDFIYILSNDAEVVCLTRQNGRIKWVLQLPTFEDMEAREDPIYWAGPVLAGDRLLITGSNGIVLAVSPYTGAVLGRLDLPGRSHLAPVVAGETVYILSDNAELTALH